MKKVTKVAISLWNDTFVAVERERRIRGESRSEFFRQAVEKFLKKERESLAIKDYIRGYREMPESPEEIEAVHRIGSAVLAGEPWE